MWMKNCIVPWFSARQLLTNGIWVCSRKFVPQQFSIFRKSSRYFDVNSFAVSSYREINTFLLLPIWDIFICEKKTNDFRLCKTSQRKQKYSTDLIVYLFSDTHLIYIQTKHGCRLFHWIVSCWPNANCVRLCLFSMYWFDFIWQKLTNFLLPFCVYRVLPCVLWWNRKRVPKHMTQRSSNKYRKTLISKPIKHLNIGAVIWQSAHHSERAIQ